MSSLCGKRTNAGVYRLSFSGSNEKVNSSQGGKSGLRGDSEENIRRKPPMKTRKIVVKSACRICLSARQTDGWSRLRKTKIHPSERYSGELMKLFWSSVCSKNQSVLVEVKVLEDSVGVKDLCKLIDVILKKEYIHLAVLKPGSKFRDLVLRTGVHLPEVIIRRPGHFRSPPFFGEA